MNYFCYTCSRYIRLKPCYKNFHLLCYIGIGVNNTVEKPSEVIVEKTLSLDNVMGKGFLAFQVIISNIIQKTVNGKVLPRGIKLNENLLDPQLDYIDHSNTISV